MTRGSSGNSEKASEEKRYLDASEGKAELTIINIHQNMKIS